MSENGMHSKAESISRLDEKTALDFLTSFMSHHSGETHQCKAHQHGTNSGCNDGSTVIALEVAACFYPYLVRSLSCGGHLCGADRQA